MHCVPVRAPLLLKTKRRQRSVVSPVSSNTRCEQVGVGKQIHEDPYIPNFGKTGTGAKLVKGMVIAIEPMLNSGTKNVKIAKDDWTFKTADGKRSAHFEHTILITDGDPEILTIQ